MDDYNLPSIYKQTMALAKTMVADNPKLSIDEALSKAGKQLGKQNKWETQTKPGLEKTFGPLQPSTFNQNAVQRLRNTPEVVAQRKQRANAFLDQPTEPWQPPRTEIQAFERERIKDALGGFPDVEQSRFPRDVPPRASLAHVHAVYEDPENRELIKKQIRRGLPLGGETFYASLYPVKLAAMEAGISPEKFDAWVHSIAPASARNSIMNEMAVGQAIRDAYAHGSDLSPESLAQVRAAFKAQHKIGLPMMPVHEEGVAKVLQNNLNLRDLNRANIPTNYKIPTYGAQKAGDFAHSWVGDVHEATGETLGSEHHPYFTKAGGFGNPEYGAAEQHMLDIAKELGIPGGTAQAGRWFGGGELTGLKSPRGDALDLLEKQVAYTLHHQGITPTPQEVRKYVLQMIGTGKGHLLPWYKKVGMPDLRVKNKKEGGSTEPTLDEMRAHLVLHKADGGAIDIKEIGAEEAPNMEVKEFLSPGMDKISLPVGGVDFQPQMFGKQMLPGQPPQQPGMPGQPPGAPQGAMPLGALPQGAMPPGMPGAPPAPPKGPPSNILAMTPQGQALQAMRPNPMAMPRPPMLPMKSMAKGGSTTPSVQDMKQALDKFLEGSKVKERMYHGTAHYAETPKATDKLTSTGIKKFKKKSTGTFLSPDPEVSEYTNTKGGLHGAVYPLYVKVQNPFDFENQMHIDALAKQLKENPERLNQLLAGGTYDNWDSLEQPYMQRAIKKLGHDAYYTREDGRKNLAVYDPRMIKSATGNRGTYDTSKNDITMKRGGSTHDIQLTERML